MISTNITFKGGMGIQFAIEIKYNGKSQNILASFISYACSQIIIMTNKSALLIFVNRRSFTNDKSFPKHKKIEVNQ